LKQSRDLYAAVQAILGSFSVGARLYEAAVAMSYIEVGARPEH
jgi:hypothetical protein